MNYATKLQNIGFKKEEADVYLACLKLGTAKVSQLTKEIDIPRTTIYVYLKNLLEKGYIKKTKKQGIEYFSAVDPKIISEDSKERLESFVGIIPQLEKLLDFPTNKPKIEYSDTAQGLLKLYNEMTKMDYKNPPYLIESGEAIKHNLEIMGDDFSYKWQKKLLDKKIVTQGIITHDAIEIIKNLPEKIKKVAQQRPATVRVIDNQDFPFSINLYLIHPNKSFLIDPQENFVITIENNFIYNSLVALYKTIYEKADGIDIKEL
ncbi:TrmB family transcriptional regulator [bacterium]|nr:MAG: TrmB family transcriptional regulator [bacterium]